MLDEDHEQAAGSLIRAYGEYWSRRAIDWESGELKGQRRHFKVTSKNATPKAKMCDAWKQVGIYALYDHYKLVYVGMASSEKGLGDRLLAHHTKPRLSGRWDSFSWFGLRSFDEAGVIEQFKSHNVDATSIARTLELVSILVADPPLNRAGGRFAKAEILDFPEKRRADHVEKLLVEIKEEVKRLKK